MKIKYLLIFAIIPLLLVSAFSYAPRANQVPSPTATPTPTPQIIDPTATPSPSPQLTNTVTPTPYPTSQGTPGFSRGFYVDMESTPPPVLEEPQRYGPISLAQNITADVWKVVADNAWQYFQPEIGVDINTGLPGAGLGWPYFTEWDLGVYIQAALDAQKIGLKNLEGWDPDSRLEKVLSFLENRPLDANNLPFCWYEAATGNGRPDLLGAGQSNVSIADAGRLLVALQNLKSYKGAWTGRINYVVKERTRYSIMLDELVWLSDSVNIYDYFVVSGFAAFWPQVANVSKSIMDNIMSTWGRVNTYGVKLPLAKISCEPLLLSMFDLKQPDKRLFNLTQQVYLAHEARFNATGNYTAFSEGNTGTQVFAYEWVVLPDNRTWVVTDPNLKDLATYDPPIPPIIYYKVSLSFLSLYKTSYAKNMTIHLENFSPVTIAGYNDGVDETGRKVMVFGSNTNGLIMSAARFAMFPNG